MVILGVVQSVQYEQIEGIKKAIANRTAMALVPLEDGNEYEIDQRRPKNAKADKKPLAHFLLGAWR